MHNFTNVEKEVIRAGIMVPMAMVSEAEEAGFLGSFKESTAGVNFLKNIDEPFRSILAEDSVTPEAYEEPEADTATAYVHAAVRVLQTKHPELVRPYEVAVLAGCTKIAEAAKGVSATEQALLDEVKEALTDI